MENRNIYYIDETKDPLDTEIEVALDSNIEENLQKYFSHIIANYAMYGIDVINYPISREIYYVADE